MKPLLIFITSVVAIPLSAGISSTSKRMTAAAGGSPDKMAPLVVAAFERGEFTLTEVVYRKELYLKRANDNSVHTRFSMPGEIRIDEEARIMSINGRSVDTMNSYEGARMMVQPVGTPITIVVLPKGSSTERLLSMVVSGKYGPDGRHVEFKMRAERPNKAPEPTPTAVTSPAAQEPRQP